MGATYETFGLKIFVNMDLSKLCYYYTLTI